MKLPISSHQSSYALQKKTISRSQAIQLNRSALQTLSTLVTPTGIYASAATDIFHGLFGRDTATVYAFIFENYKRIRKSAVKNRSAFSQAVLYEHEALFIRALYGFLYIGKYQGKEDNPLTGEERGKAIHEVRHDPTSYRHLTEGMSQRGLKPFYVDTEGVLKNWDTVDATFLRVLLIGKTLFLLSELQGERVTPSLRRAFEAVQDEVRSSHFQDSVEWCLSNAIRYGFPGFSFNENTRAFTNFPNKHWADSHFSLIHEDEDTTPYPKKPVEVSAYAWAAFLYAADLYKNRKKRLARRLYEEAKRLKKQFNQDADHGGFLMKDSGLYYFAEGVDGAGKQIQVVMCNPVMSLWATYHGRHIFERKYIRDVIHRALMQDMFREDAGIRTYHYHIKKRDTTLYHKGPDTYWPFVSVAAAIGMERMGYARSSTKVLKAALTGINYFASKPHEDPNFAPFIENFIAEDGIFRPFFLSDSGQTSCREQAWTASGALYATTTLLFSRESYPD